MSRRIIILSTFVVSLAANFWGMLAEIGWLTLPALLAGWYVADMASGLAHMLMDYLPCPKGKGLADIYFYAGSRESAEYLAMRSQRMASLSAFQRIAYDFKNHHPRPDALGRRSLWPLIGSTLVAGVLPASLALNLAQWLLPVPGWLLAFCVSALIGGGFAQYFHASLHRPDNPWFIGAMRRLGLLMTPAAHQLHHDTLQRDFATNCGWSNALLNPLFRALHTHGYLDSAGLEPTA